MGIYSYFYCKQHVEFFCCIVHIKTMIKITNGTSDVLILKYQYRWYRPISVVSASSIGTGKYSRYLPILFKHKINIKFFLLYKYKKFLFPPGTGLDF